MNKTNISNVYKLINVLVNIILKNSLIIKHYLFAKKKNVITLLLNQTKTFVKTIVQIWKFIKN